MAKSKTSNNSPNVVARAILDKIRAIQEAIPGYEPATPSGGRSLVPMASLPNPFIEAACSAIESSNALRIAVKMDPDATREAVAFAASFEPVADELEATAKGMRHTISVIRAKAGDDALHSYDVAKSLSRTKDGAALVPHVSSMKNALGRGGRRTPKAPKPAPQQ